MLTSSVKTLSLSREQLDALIATAAKHSAEDALMLRCTFNHGLRVSECLKLTSANIKDGFLSTDRQKRSNSHTVQLLLDERDELLALCERKPVGRLFPMSRMTYWRRMQRYGTEAGIPFFLQHPHVLRHTCGRLGFLGGMSIPEVVTYLGHKNPGNSLRYMQASEQEAASAFAKAAALLPSR